MKIFERAAYACIHKEKRQSKLTEHAERAVFLRIEEGLYRIYTSRTQRVILTKHLTFDETEFSSTKQVEQGVEIDVSTVEDDKKEVSRPIIWRDYISSRQASEIVNTNPTNEEAEISNDLHNEGNTVEQEVSPVYITKATECVRSYF